MPTAARSRASPANTISSSARNRGRCTASANTSSIVRMRTIGSDVSTSADRCAQLRRERLERQRRAHGEVHAGRRVLEDARGLLGKQEQLRTSGSVQPALLQILQDADDGRERLRRSGRPWPDSPADRIHVRIELPGERLVDQRDGRAGDVARLEAAAGNHRDLHRIDVADRHGVVVVDVVDGTVGRPGMPSKSVSFALTGRRGGRPLIAAAPCTPGMLLDTRYAAG